MIVNAFVFLYLKLTRNWWNKEFKRAQVFRTCLGRKIVNLNLFPTHKIFRKICFSLKLVCASVCVCVCVCVRVSVDVARYRQN